MQWWGILIGGSFVEFAGEGHSLRFVFGDLDDYERLIDVLAGRLLGVAAAHTLYTKSK